MAGPFQVEWPGFYLEYRFDEFTRRTCSNHWVAFQKDKGRQAFDYDLVLHDADETPFFGDLKASNEIKKEAPGNDARALHRCIAKYRRFWYVVYEHQTWHSIHNSNRATILWNEWKRDIGYFTERNRDFNPLSYHRRFKEAVDFNSMFILEINSANLGVVLGEFHQGKQPDGVARALKVMIKKTNIENFLVFSQRR